MPIRSAGIRRALVLDHDCESQLDHETDEEETAITALLDSPTSQASSNEKIFANIIDSVTILSKEYAPTQSVQSEMPVIQELTPRNLSAERALRVESLTKTCHFTPSPLEFEENLGHPVDLVTLDGGINKGTVVEEPLSASRSPARQIEIQIPEDMSIHSEEAVVTKDDDSYLLMLSPHPSSLKCCSMRKTNIPSIATPTSKSILPRIPSSGLSQDGDRHSSSENVQENVIGSVEPRLSDLAALVRRLDISSPETSKTNIKVSQDSHPLVLTDSQQPQEHCPQNSKSASDPHMVVHVEDTVNNADGMFYQHKRTPAVPIFNTGSMRAYPNSSIYQYQTGSQSPMSAALPTSQARAKNRFPQLMKALPPLPSDQPEGISATGDTSLGSHDFPIRFSPFSLSRLSTPRSTCILLPAPPHRVDGNTMQRDQIANLISSSASDSSIQDSERKLEACGSMASSVALGLRDCRLQHPTDNEAPCSKEQQRGMRGRRRRLKLKQSRASIADLYKECPNAEGASAAVRRSIGASGLLHESKINNLPGHPPAQRPECLSPQLETATSTSGNDEEKYPIQPLEASCNGLIENQPSLNHKLHASPEVQVTILKPPRASLSHVEASKIRGTSSGSGCERSSSPSLRRRFSNLRLRFSAPRRRPSAEVRAASAMTRADTDLVTDILPVTLQSNPRLRYSPSTEGAVSASTRGFRYRLFCWMRNTKENITRVCINVRRGRV
jgi:hypothetical protein